MPVVDISTGTAALAAEAMEFVRTVGILPWAPAKEPTIFYPEWQQHATGRDGRFGQLVNVAADLPSPAPWRLVSGSFLLDATSWSVDDSAVWMRRMLGEGGAA